MSASLTAAYAPPPPASMKVSLDQLAVFGGAPSFSSPLHVGQPNIGRRRRLMARLTAMLDRRWLTNNGRLVQEFEATVARFIGVRHCIAVCNGTVALELAIRALGLRGEVIVPSFTFVATAHALQWHGLTPVFCDIDPATHNLDPAQVARLITPRTAGIIGVHLWGRPCAVDELTRLARRRKVALLFDAAHAFACSHRGRLIGGFGQAEVFSFHATKLINTFEGGAVTTNDDELAARVRLMRNFGFAGYDNVTSIGTNGKLSEAAAAMGLTNIESLSEFIAVNRRNYGLYRRLLAGLEGIALVKFDPAEQNNYQYVVLEIDESKTGIGRDDLVAILHAENVLARRYFYPGCHRMEPYRSRFPNAGASLPATESVAARVAVLPNGTGLRQKEIRIIADLLRLALTHASLLRERMQSVQSRV